MQPVVRIDRVEQLRLIGWHVVIKPDKKPDHVGLILVPDSARERKADEVIAFGEVVAVGPGMKVRIEDWHGPRDANGVGRWPIDVEPGMRVIYRPWGGENRKIMIGDVEHDIISDGSIEAVVE